MVLTPSRSKRLPDLAAGCCVLVWCMFASMDASAQVDEEIICDPENPACAPIEKDAAQAGEGVSESQDEETICDPENPACTGASSSGGDGEPRYVLEGVQKSDGEGSSGRITLPSLQWGSSLALDTRWSSGQEDHIESGSSVDAIWGHDFDLNTRVELRAHPTTGRARHVEETRRTSPAAPLWLGNPTTCKVFC